MKNVTLGSVVETTLLESRRFFKEDVPELLALTARSLQKNKLFPTSWKEFSSYSQSDWLDVIPVVCGILVAASWLLYYHWFPNTNYGKGAAGRYEYRVTRSVLLRAQALCYFCGFLTSVYQHRTLWGEHGLLPANPRSNRPTPMFDWFGFGDLQLEFVSLLGLFFCVLLVKYESMFPAAACWVLYLSIVNMQAPFTYSYGWEWLTCEGGFLAIFLCSPPFLRKPAQPSLFVVMLFRWLAFRLLIGAGMSKVGRNSSACWRELTCTTTHYFTQPIPNPLSWYFHFLPFAVHQIEVAMTLSRAKVSYSY